MPRNASGVYSLPVAAYVSGTTIKSSDMNSNLSDIATALTQSLATTGVSSMTAPFISVAGTVAAPGLTFAGALGTGFYLAGPNQIGVAVAGTTAATFNSDKSVSWAGLNTFSGNLIANGTITLGGVTSLNAQLILGGGGSFGVSTVFVGSGASHAIGTVPDPGASAGTIRFLREDATWATPGASALPTVQSFGTGSGNYTPAANVTKIRVRMCGPGGGGGAQSTNNGSNGSAATSFGSWTANPGLGGIHGGATNNAGGAGGTGGTNGTGTLIARINGGNGMGGQFTSVANIFFAGGPGGANPFGGAGYSGSGAVAGGPGATNTGAGGAGAGGQSATGSGAGGGAGEYVEFWVSVPATTAYVIGSIGAGGAAGGQAGGNGAAGVIYIEEYYN